SPMLSAFFSAPSPAMRLSLVMGTRRSDVKSRTLSVLACGALLVSLPVIAQTDPGVRGGSPGAGGALSSVLANSPGGILTLFNDGQSRFQEVDSVTKNSIPGENGFGLGPRYN